LLSWQVKPLADDRRSSSLDSAELRPIGAGYRGRVSDPDSPDVVIRIENFLGHITLNRPRQINALNFGMIRAVQDALDAWVNDPVVKLVLIDGAGDRGLCAGGDIRLLYEGITGDAAAPATFWADEYRMNSTLGAYPKPIIAYMSGMTLGGGVGISGHCSVRIVTETSLIGMPETAIGLSPDVGGLYLLSRAPGESGTHAALTGARFGPADAIQAGLADHFVRVAGLRDITERLRVGVIPEFTDEPPPGSMAAERVWIDECYAGDDVVEIIERLQARPDPAALAAAGTLAAMSPTALKVTLQALRRAALLTLDEVLDQDLRVGCHFLAHPDLAEGIRAMIIDKDRRPTWNPATLDEVTDAEVRSYFEPLASGWSRVR
jgi:enoyl-CoA hydratase